MSNQFDDNDDDDEIYEELNIRLVFKEERVRGTEQLKCVVVAIDTDAENDRLLIDCLEVSSWEMLKKSYPTLDDLVEHMFWSAHWSAQDLDDRYLVLVDCEGHDGLYEYNDGDDIRVLWSDIESNEIVYPQDYILD